MNSIKIPVTLSPHFLRGKPAGYYILAQRLFPRGAPPLIKQQWFGFTDDSLIVTVGRPPQDTSLISMAIRHSLIDAKPVSWLAPAKIWTMPLGFKSYIPGLILKPRPAGAIKIETFGFFKQWNEIFYLMIPAINWEILLNKKELT